jgi:hypothetical protein
MTQGLQRGLSAVSFLYGGYVGDAGPEPTTYLEYSTDFGASWIEFGRIPAGQYPTTLTEWTSGMGGGPGIDVSSSDIRLRIRSDIAGSQTSRFNIDNLYIYTM